MARVAVVADTEIINDPRPSRVCAALHESHDVFSVGRGNTFDTRTCSSHTQLPSPVSRRDPIRNRLRKTLRLAKIIGGSYEAVLSSDKRLIALANAIQGLSADVAWIHDLELLPFALNAPNIRRVIFDAREYYPAQYEESIRWRLTEAKYKQHLVDKYLQRAHAVVTVSNGLVSQYRKTCDVHATLLPSYPLPAELDVALNTSSPIRLVYHGKAHENRKCESLLSLMSLLGSRYELTMMLVGGRKDYVHKLSTLAARTDNVTLSAPVPMASIAKATNHFDIGLCAIPATTFNLRNCLPNKLFEMIQARLAIVSWPSPDIADVIRQHDVGLVADNFSVNSLADTINKMSREDIRQFKFNSHHAAKALSFESNRTAIVELTESVIDTRRKAA